MTVSVHTVLYLHIFNEATDFGICFEAQCCGEPRLAGAHIQYIHRAPGSRWRVFEPLERASRDRTVKGAGGLPPGVRQRAPPGSAKLRNAQFNSVILHATRPSSSPRAGTRQANCPENNHATPYPPYPPFRHHHRVHRHRAARDGFELILPFRFPFLTQKVGCGAAEAVLWWNKFTDHVHGAVTRTSECSWMGILPGAAEGKNEPQ